MIKRRYLPNFDYDEWRPVSLNCMGGEGGGGEGDASNGTGDGFGDGNGGTGDSSAGVGDSAGIGDSYGGYGDDGSGYGGSYGGTGDTGDASGGYGGYGGASGDGTGDAGYGGPGASSDGYSDGSTGGPGYDGGIGDSSGGYGSSGWGESGGVGYGDAGFGSGGFGTGDFGGYGTGYDGGYSDASVGGPGYDGGFDSFSGPGVGYGDAGVGMGGFGTGSFGYGDQGGLGGIGGIGNGGWGESGGVGNTGYGFGDFGGPATGMDSPGGVYGVGQGMDQGMFGPDANTGFDSLGLGLGQTAEGVSAFSGPGSMGLGGVGTNSLAGSTTGFEGALGAPAGTFGFTGLGNLGGVGNPMGSPDLSDPNDPNTAPAPANSLAQFDAPFTTPNDLGRDPGLNDITMGKGPDWGQPAINTGIMGMNVAPMTMPDVNAMPDPATVQAIDLEPAPAPAPEPEAVPEVNVTAPAPDLTTSPNAPPSQAQPQDQTTPAQAVDQAFNAPQSAPTDAPSVPGAPSGWTGQAGGTQGAPGTQGNPGVAMYGQDSQAQQAQGDPSKSILDLIAAQAAEQAKGKVGEAKGSVTDAPGKPSFYAPGRGGAMEGPNSTSAIGPNGLKSKEGGGVPQSLWDVAAARAKGGDTYVTLAAVNGRDSKGNQVGPNFFAQTKGQVLNIPSVTFPGPDGKDITLTNVKGVVHDSGPGRAGTGPAHFDIALGGKSATNQMMNVAKVNGIGPEAAPKGLEIAGKAPAPIVLPPGVTQFPGSEGTFSKTGATANAQPYQAIVVHVTGKQSIEDQGKWQNSNSQGLGYPYVIDKNGQVYAFGNPDNSRSNHMRDEQGRSDRFDLTNKNSIGIGFITGGGNPTAAQMEAAKGLVASLQSKYGIPAGQVFGHGELQGKDKERSTLGPGGTPEGQVMAAQLRGDSPYDDQQVAAPKGTLQSLFGRGPLGIQGVPTPQARPDLPGVPTQGVPTPQSRPNSAPFFDVAAGKGPGVGKDAPFDPGRAAGKGQLAFTSEPGDKGADQQTTPQTSQQGTTNPAEVGYPDASTLAPGPSNSALPAPGSTTAAPGVPHNNNLNPGRFVPAPGALESLLGPTITSALQGAPGILSGLPGLFSPPDDPSVVSYHGYPSHDFAGPTGAHNSLPVGDPGGLQNATPTAPETGFSGHDDFGPSSYTDDQVAAPAIDLPAVTTEAPAPLSVEGPMQDDVQSAPSLLAALTDSGGSPLIQALLAAARREEEDKELLAAAQKLAKAAGISVEAAKQVLTQAMTQDGGVYA